MKNNRLVKIIAAVLAVCLIVCGCGKNAASGSAQEASDNAEIYEADEIFKWLNKFYWRFFSQQFKRSCLPDGPKVGSVAVSPRGDLRMPSDAVVALWIEELKELR